MRIAQIVLPGASAWDLKSQRIDFEALSAAHDVAELTARDVDPQRFDVAHVYGPAGARRADPGRLRVPYVASARPRHRLFAFRRAEPARVLTPLRDTPDAFVPEAVADAWFGIERLPDVPRIGSFARPDLAGIVERTVSRIRRFREDVEWKVFEAPTPGDFASLAAWIDPAIADSDLDGFVAEAVAAGVIVVAARTAINDQRLEHGRTGFLVPRDDPNELTHAILAALFKPAAAREREIAARQTASKFRVRHRLRALLALYESVIG